jgi:flavodoxin
MKCAVVYVSKGGNTEKLARAVAQGAGVQAQPLGGIRALDTPVELLFVGASIYAGKFDGAMRSFLQTVSAGQVKRAAVFGSACGAKSALAEVKAYVESTKGKLKLFYLPGYSPELNPDETVWSYVKHHVVGKKIITGPEQFLKVVKAALYSLLHKPAIIAAFFEKPSLQYI